MHEPPIHSFAIRQYLLYAMHIIREHTIVLWLLCFIGLCSTATLLFRGTSYFWPLNIFSILLSTVATPIFYGIYHQLIDDSYTSLRSIARSYVLSYLWLLIRMYLPVIFLASIPAILFANRGSGGYLEVGLITFSLIYLFVIPHFYRTGRQQGAISRGITFLFRHLSASAPLLLAVLLLESGVLLIQYNKAALHEGYLPILAALDFFVFIVASLIDLAIFIILLFIVKNAEQDTT